MVAPRIINSNTHFLCCVFLLMTFTVSNNLKSGPQIMLKVNFKPTINVQ